MLTTSDQHYTVSKNLKSLKNGQETPIRRKSLAANHKVSTPKDESRKGASFAKKLIKSVRRSLAPSEAMVIVRDQEEKEVSHLFENHAPEEDSEARAIREAREARRAARRKENGLSEPCMQFDVNNSIEMDDLQIQMQTVDYDMAFIGGMIKLHQYSYKEYKLTNFPVHRDGANFFKNADPLCFSTVTQAPVLMAHCGLGDISKIAFWYRDHFSSRDLNRHDIKGLYNEDGYTTFDKVFDNVGRDGCQMMVEEMKRMEGYCVKKFECTGIEVYEQGIQFWRTISPLHLSRNYQLALILCKQRKWNHEDVEQWFRMLYTEQCWRGARGCDVFVERMPETQV